MRQNVMLCTRFLKRAGKKYNLRITEKHIEQEHSMAQFADQSYKKGAEHYENILCLHSKFQKIVSL